MTLDELQSKCRDFISESLPADAAHDLSHVKRVVKNCIQLTEIEGADAEITIPAAWLHDCVAVAKNSPLRSRGSRLAADAATSFLAGHAYPEPLLAGIHHAIEAHSFSADIPTRTLEAEVVQDGRANPTSKSAERL